MTILNRDDITPRGRRAALAGTALGLAAAAWLAAVTPAQAGGGGGGERVERAREACRDIARNRDWKDIQTEVRDRDDNRVVVSVRGERDGEDRERRCVFRGGEAELDDQ